MLPVINRAPNTYFMAKFYTAGRARSDRRAFGNLRVYSGSPEVFRLVKIFIPVVLPAILLVSLLTPIEGQWLARRTAAIPRNADGKPNMTAPAPRAGDGKPDLSGLWEMIMGAAGGNIAERSLGDLNAADVQPWAQALVKQRIETFGRDNPHYRCLPLGPAYSTTQGMKRFIQTPGMLTILSEDLTYRVIFTDGRELESDPNPSWMGYSVGHWDGETLVVESIGFNDRTWLVGGYPHTEKLRMTERFRRTDFGHLDVAVTFQDPGVYAKPWTVPSPMQLAPDTEMLESICNEQTDDGQEHWVGKASDIEKSRVTVAPEILTKYTGIYKGIYLRGPRTVEVTISNGTLFTSADGGEKRPLIPQSETNFTGTGLTYRFVRNGEGNASDMIEGHVSGDYKYARQK